jgi:ribosomal protein S18 acetylase RimI-like enzyme
MVSAKNKETLSDLSGNSSSRLSRPLLRDADAIFRAELEKKTLGRFALREAAASDRVFLLELLAAVHVEAQRRLGGESVVVLGGPLLELQLDAQRLAYQANHPRAVDYVVLRRESGARMGRMLVDWAPAPGGVSVAVDLAVLPAERAGAAGWSLLRAWVTTCDRLGFSAALHVMPQNPARRLYRRLGFVEEDPLVFPVSMRRAPR